MNDDGELKLVHREETFSDHAVDELGKIQATCLCRLQYGRCMLSDCKECSRHNYLGKCKSAMSDYDRVRLNTYTSYWYSKYNRNPFSWMRHKQMLKWWLILMISCITLPAVICCIIMMVV